MDANAEIVGFARELLDMLRSVEESDSGNEFHPTTIRSCRVMHTRRLEQIFKRLDELLPPDCASTAKTENTARWFAAGCPDIELPSNPTKPFRTI